MEDKEDNVEKKTAFIAFLDDDERKQEDWVNILEETDSYIKFLYNNKEITIPWHRVLKVKKEVEE